MSYIVCTCYVPDTVLGTWDSSVDTKILTSYNLHEWRLVKEEGWDYDYISWSIAPSSYPEVFNCVFVAMSALKNETEQTVLLVQELKTLGSIFSFTVVVKSLSVSVSYRVLSESVLGPHWRTTLSEHKILVT